MSPSAQYEISVNGRKYRVLASFSLFESIIPIEHGRAWAAFSFEINVDMEIVKV